ncbi:ATP-binding cassette domain-containing protein, partial [bacterium]|nr:ATP-binding cassette domain-containing protein [bacterium]
MTLVELMQAQVQRDGRTLLGPLDMRIEADEFWGIVGPNGAGKSTLLKVLAGALSLTSGTIHFSNCDSPRSWIRRNVGLLFQHHDFLPDLPFTVEDVVGFGRSGRAGIGRPLGKSDREAVRCALADLGLESFRKRLYRELSGGERQKVQLARLVAQEAVLLLLDEPTAGLD